MGQHVNPFSRRNNWGGATPNLSPPPTSLGCACSMEMFRMSERCLYICLMDKKKITSLFEEWMGLDAWIGSFFWSLLAHTILQNLSCRLHRGSAARFSLVH